MSEKPASESEGRSIHIGEHLIKQVSLSLAEIANFATLCGDFNPLHHNEEYARQTRFGGVIACGPHITSLMMGLTATYFSRERAMLGLDFNFRFLKAVKADELFTIDWKIVSVEPKLSLAGEIVTLEGRVTNELSQIAVTGQGKVLVVEKL